MAASQSPEEYDISPFVLEAPGTPSSEHTFAQPKRSITPRGPLFPNLGEAHRKITSRLAPDNPFRKQSDGSQSSADISFQEPLSPASTDGPDSLEKPRLLRQHASDSVAPHPARSMVGRSLTGRQSIALPSRKAATFSTTVTGHAGYDSVRQAQHPDTTGSTVTRIVDQYATNSDDPVSTSIDIPELAYTFEPLDRIDGAATRLGFRGEESRAATWSSTQACRNTSSPPDFRISAHGTDMAQTPSPYHLQSPTYVEKDWLRGLDLPERRPSITSQRNPSPCTSSSGYSRVIGVDWLKEVEAAGDSEDVSISTRSLIPPPLRIPSNRNGRNATLGPENPLSNNVGSSAGSGPGDASTDSNDDPFKYDNPQYRRIRQLGKEREVSCALRRLNPSDTRTSIVNESPAVSPRKLSKLRDFAIGVTATTSQGHPEGVLQDGSFFDPVAFRALHGDAVYDQNTDIKVVISKSSEYDEQRMNTDRNAFGLSIDRNKRRSDRSRYDQATDVDWVTEATSEADFDIALGNDAFAQGIKATGSSIADYSDDGYNTNLPKFGSRDSIMHHPSDAPDSYEMHDLKGPKHGALLPPPCFSRFNGFAQNNARFNLNLPRSTNSQTGMLNPFRRDYKRAEASSYFTYKTEGNVQSKYEFRDSTSTCAPAKDSNQTYCGTEGIPGSMSIASINSAELLDDKADPFTSVGDQPQVDSSDRKIQHRRVHSRQPARVNIPISSYCENKQTTSWEADYPTPLTASSYGQGHTPSSSKFSFRLLDLFEAQEIQKVRRASEDTNKTTSTVKYHRSFSESSSRPTLTPMSRPSAAYVRRDSQVRRGSRLSSTFTPLPWHAHESEDTPGLGEYTPLDASSTRPLTTPVDNEAETPTASKKIWSKQTSSMSRIGHPDRCLLLDKRVRPKASDQTLQSIMNRDIATVRETEDHFVSRKAKSRRQLFFYGMLSLSAFPFFALLVLNGNFDNSLSWLTQGEVYRLTRKQRRVIKIVFIIEVIVYASSVAAIIAYFVTVSNAHR